MSNIEQCDALNFFATQIEAMLAVEPNMGAGKKRSKYGRNAISAWVMRGYYPNTPVFFKITIIKTKDYEGLGWPRASDYYAKITIPPISQTSGRYFMVDGREFAKYRLQSALEGEVFGTTECMSPYLQYTIKMSPKGVALNRLKKRKVRSST